MRIQQFIVDLNNSVAVYKPGDEISGRIILRLAKSIRIRGIHHFNSPELSHFLQNCSLWSF